MKSSRVNEYPTQRDPSDQHNDPDCGGTFVRVLDGRRSPFTAAPKALVCSECGAWKPMGPFSGQERDEEKAL